MVSYSHPPVAPASPALVITTTAMNERSLNQGPRLLKRVASHFLVDQSSGNSPILVCLTSWQDCLSQFHMVLGS
ncbi:Atp-Dependent Rna Helicase Ddx11-Like Protein 8-Like [Manis pentadactyla]|nr:Atp-Dependent Rna Helicase Ddx11-Like Protein 8-Like [Manis pentadactyla]